ncbi:GNAT family N-acetyltransferase [bacterium]|jgi:RimJ/RimL family protein N-acetyltransferase|nr:GNAT family N-acetyltransferase [bacterium]
MQSPYEGRLIRLRAREREDEALLYQWFNDPEVTEFLSMRYPLSHAQERAFIESASEISYGKASFAVETLADSRLIGGVGLERTSPENRSAVLGIALGDKTYWDSGYGTDTMRAICRFGFEMMNLHRIELEVFEENRRAIAVYERVGFAVEGCRRDAQFKFGRYTNSLVMGLLEGELIGHKE